MDGSKAFVKINEDKIVQNANIARVKQLAAFFTRTSNFCIKDRTLRKPKNAKQTNGSCLELKNLSYTHKLSCPMSIYLVLSKDEFMS